MRLLKRKFYEKTGLEIEVAEKVGKVQHSYTVHRVTLYGYVTDLARNSSVAVDPADGAGYCWVDLEDLDQYAFSAGQRKLIERFLNI